jgi:hypothetical protein
MRDISVSIKCVIATLQAEFPQLASRLLESRYIVP